jgi:hypothetical protein
MYDTLKRNVHRAVVDLHQISLIVFLLTGRGAGLTLPPSAMEIKSVE